MSANEIIARAKAKAARGQFKKVRLTADAAALDASGAKGNRPSAGASGSRGPRGGQRNLRNDFLALAEETEGLADEIDAYWEF